MPVLTRSPGSLSVVVVVSTLALGCANAIEPLSTSGAGGAGGDSGATTTATSSSGGGGMVGPCVYAEDCAALSDACNVGACINGVCQKTAANENGPCDDGKQCTTTDHCVAGLCTGPLKACGAAAPCHVGMCDVATDTCVEVAGNDGAGCIDDDPCTLTSTCSAGQCLGAQQVDCSFLDSVCGVGVCDPVQGCVAVPQNNGTACSDGLYCTDNDACNAGQCVGTPKACAPPGNICMIGTCDEINDKCSSVAGNNGQACDDGSTCTVGEICSNGVCGGGQPANAGGVCDDGDSCTTVSTCNAAGGCIGSAPILSCINGDGCCPSGCDIQGDDDCQPPSQFNVLSTADVTYQGIDYLVLEVSLKSVTAGLDNWCYEYTNLCQTYGYVPTGCGNMYSDMANGYGICKSEYLSDGESNSLGCNPSGGVSAAAQQAGYFNASFDNSFGYHYCDDTTCTKTWCSGMFCNTALSYWDTTKPIGYTLCKK